MSRNVDSTDVCKYEKSAKELSVICQSNNCVRAAAQIIDKIDFSVDPCDDFYQFSCGNYVKTKPVPDDRLSRNILQEIQDQMYVDMKTLFEEENKNDSIAIRKAKQFYNSCMREPTSEDEVAAGELIADLIQSSGGRWCLLESMLDNNKACQTDRRFDLEKRLADAFMNQIPSLFNMYIASPDDKNDTKYALHVSPMEKVTFVLRTLGSFTFSITLIWETIYSFN